MSQQSPARTRGDAPEATRTLHRLVLPEASGMDTVALYVDSGTPNVTRPADESAKQVVALEETSIEQRLVRFEDIRSRRSMAVRPGERVSYGTYFNAFPAAYWRRWTNVEAVTLRVRTAGSGTVMVYKSNARGNLQLIDTREVEATVESAFDLTLEPFGDGGWYWFELVADNDTFALEGAQWDTQGDPVALGSVTLQITTMNKPDFCINNLRLLADHPDVVALIEEILIVDQGTQLVRDEDGFAEVSAALGGKLRVIEQSNLGGSGGFARGMYEAVQNGSDNVLLVDDDVVIEPESIERMLAFEAHCKRPTIVGGHMFDLYNRTSLHTFGEVVNPYRFFWMKANEKMQTAYDFAGGNLRDAKWMHRRFDVDYNGWWMCLIPTQIIREIGLALPMFIKWDDAEYGVRARERGFSTVSLPGAALWHVSWVDKDDSVGWQAYFHARNRTIAALLHSPYERGGRIPRELYYHDIKHLFSMQYSTVTLHNEALRDVLAGPEQLPGLLGTKLPELRSTLSEFSDAQYKKSVDDFPGVRLAKPPKRGQQFAEPARVTLIPWAAKVALRLLTKPVDEAAKERPQAHIAHQDNTWWRLARYDSAIVSNAEGTAASWYKRSPRKMRELLAESARLHGILHRDWKELSQQYREALPELTSLDAWGRIFAEHTVADRRS